MIDSHKKLLDETVAKLTSHEGGELWDVLSALRGPDSGDMWLREATTAVIRWKLGLTLKNAGGFVVNEDDSERAALRSKLKEGTYVFQGAVADYHFLIHARKAFLVLGLTWDYTNK